MAMPQGMPHEKRATRMALAAPMAAARGADCLNAVRASSRSTTGMPGHERRGQPNAIDALIDP